MTKIHLLFMTAQFEGRKTTTLSTVELTDLWRLQNAGYVHIISGIIYGTIN